MKMTCIKPMIDDAWNWLKIDMGVPWLQTHEQLVSHVPMCRWQWRVQWLGANATAAIENDWKPVASTTKRIDKTSCTIPKTARNPKQCCSVMNSRNHGSPNSAVRVHLHVLEQENILIVIGGARNYYKGISDQYTQHHRNQIATRHEKSLVATLARTCGSRCDYYTKRLGLKFPYRIYGRP